MGAFEAPDVLDVDLLVSLADPRTWFRLGSVSFVYPLVPVVIAVCLIWCAVRILDGRGGSLRILGAGGIVVLALILSAEGIVRVVGAFTAVDPLFSILLALTPLAALAAWILILLAAVAAAIDGADQGRVWIHAAGNAAMPFGYLVLMREALVGGPWWEWALAAGVFVAAAVVAGRFRRRGAPPTSPVRAVLDRCAVGFLAVSAVWGLAGSTVWLAHKTIWSVSPLGSLSIERSDDAEAIRRAATLFVLADRVEFAGTPPDQDLPDTVRIPVPDDDLLVSPLPLAEAHAAAVRARPGLAEFRSIIRSGDLAYPWPARVSLADTLPRFFSLIGLSRAAAVKARIAAEEGRWNDAVDGAAFLLDAGRSIRDMRGPLLSYLTALAILDMGAKEAAHLLERLPPGVDVGPIARAVEAARVADPGWRNIWAGEYETVQTSFRDLRQGTEAKDDRGRLFLSPFIDEDLMAARAEKVFVAAAEWGDRPYHEVAADVAAARDRPYEVPSFWRAPTNVIGEIFFAIAVPQLFGVIETRAVTRARLGALGSALAVRGGRAWEDLDDTLRTNPLTGRPFETVGDPPDRIRLELRGTNCGEDLYEVPLRTGKTW